MQTGCGAGASWGPQEEGGGWSVESIRDREEGIFCLCPSTTAYLGKITHYFPVLFSFRDFFVVRFGLFLK